MTWTGYVHTARALGAAGEAEAAAARAVDAATAAAVLEARTAVDSRLDSLASRLDAQQTMIDGLAARLRAPIDWSDVGDRGAPAPSDFEGALRRAAAAADDADAAAAELDEGLDHRDRVLRLLGAPLRLARSLADPVLRYFRPLLRDPYRRSRKGLSGTQWSFRTLAVYFAWSILSICANLLVWAVGQLGWGDPRFSDAFLPLFMFAAFVGGYLTVRYRIRSPHRNELLGLLICFVLGPLTGAYLARLFFFPSS